MLNQVKTFKTERRPILALVMAISPAQISLFLRINSVYRKKADAKFGGERNSFECRFLFVSWKRRASVYKHGCTCCV